MIRKTCLDSKKTKKGVIMQNKKMKLFMSLSVLFTYFLICASSHNMISIKALPEENYNPSIIDSSNSITWKWNTTELVSTESTDSSAFPSLTVDSAGNVHIVWNDRTDYNSAGTDYDIFYKQWNMSSSSWSTTEVVSTESTSDSYNPSLAVDSAGNVHVVWFDPTNYASCGTDNDIFYKRWNVSSSSWTTTEVVSTESTGNSIVPSLAVDLSENVHISWGDVTDYASSGTDYDIFYKRWENSSSSWTTTEVVSTESSSGSNYPSLAVDLVGDVHVAWHDFTDYAGAGTDNDIFYKHWDTSTSSWSTTEVVSTESTGDSTNPSLAVDSSRNVYIAWHDFTDYAGAGTDIDIFYKWGDVSSSTWSATKVVSTESTGDSTNPSLAIDSSRNVYIAWFDLTNYASAGTDMDIFYKWGDAYTSAWSTTEVISKESTSTAQYPSLSTSSTDCVHITWSDFTDYAGAGTDVDIFYKVLAVPPVAPELAFIVPTPTEITTINLDWNDISGINTYHIYRSTSYIWSVESLVPISTVSSSDYIDTAPSEGFYYYVVVAENFAGNSSLSNCQYVELRFPDLDAPELSFVLPNPTEIDSVSLVWDDIAGATEYYVYRSDTYIWSVEGLTPIDSVISNSYIDTLPSEGFYFYVVVSSDGVRNSTHSNCEYIQYKLPVLSEFVIVSSLLITVSVFLFVVMRTRKKKTKPN